MYTCGRDLRVLGDKHGGKMIIVLTVKTTLQNTVVTGNGYLKTITLHMCNVIARFVLVP